MLDVANTMTTGSNKAICNKIYAIFKEIDLQKKSRNNLPHNDSLS